VNEKDANTSPANAENETGNLSLDQATDRVLSLLKPKSDAPEDAAPARREKTAPTAKAEAPEDESDRLGDDTPAKPEPDKEEEPEGEKEEEPAAEGDADEDSQEFTVKVGGKDRVLTLAEIKAGMRRKDYTQKTQTAAEERKAAATEREGHQKAREALSALLERHAAAEEAAIPPEPDAELRFSDPATWAALKQDRRDAQDRVAALRNHQSALQQQAAAEAMAAMKQRVEQEGAQLLEKVPEWKDDKRFHRETGIIRREMGKHYGFSEQELNGITDHRQVLAMRDAVRYRQMMTERAATKPDPAPVTPVLKPGGKMPADSRAVVEHKANMARLGKTGRIDDGVDALLSSGILKRRG
jgi:hypothetical protein